MENRLVVGEGQVSGILMVGEMFYVLYPGGIRVNTLDAKIQCTRILPVSATGVNEAKGTQGLSIIPYKCIRIYDPLKVQVLINLIAAVILPLTGLTSWIVRTRTWAPAPDLLLYAPYHSDFNQFFVQSILTEQLSFVRL